MWFVRYLHALVLPFSPLFALRWIFPPSVPDCSLVPGVSSERKEGTDKHTTDEEKRILHMVFQLRRGLGGVVLGSFRSSTISELRQMHAEIRWVMVVDGLWTERQIAGQDVQVLRSSRSWSSEFLSLVQTTSRILLRDDGVNGDLKRMVAAFREAGHPILGKLIPGCHALRGNSVRGTQMALLGIRIGPPYNITCDVGLSYVGKLERMLDRELRRFETETAKVQKRCEELSDYLCSLTRSNMGDYEQKMLSLDLPRLEQHHTRDILSRAGVAAPSSAFTERAIESLVKAYCDFAAQDSNMKKRLIYAPHESRRLAAFLTFTVQRSDGPLEGQMAFIGGRHCDGSPTIASRLAPAASSSSTASTASAASTASSSSSTVSSSTTSTASVASATSSSAAPFRLQAVNFNQARDDHSEFVALAQLAQLVDEETRGECEVFISHWPCVSCLGAIVQFHVQFPAIALRVDFEGWKQFQTRLRAVLT